METTQRGRHVCSTCGLHFALKASLKAHAVKHDHKPPTPNVNDPETNSGIIGNLETTEQSASVQEPGFRQHLAEKITENVETGQELLSSNVFEMENQSVSLPPRTSGNFFRCVPCQKLFDSQAKVMQHQSSKGHAGIIELNMISDEVRHSTSSPSVMGDDVGSTSSSLTNLLPYGCTSCSRYFNTEEKLRQHFASPGHQNKLKGKSDVGHEFDHALSELKISATTANFSCPYPDCGKSFDNPSKLLQHQIMKKHQDSDIGKALDDKLKLNAQQTAIHEDYSFPCDSAECLRTFPTLDRLLQHKKDKHKDPTFDPPEEQVSKVPLAEAIAGAESSDDGYMSIGPVEHQNESWNAFKQQATIPEDSQLSIQDVPLIKAPTPSYRKLCDKCDSFNEATEKKSFIFLTYVAKHILKEHPPPNYIRGFCPICNQRVDKMKNILTHVARNHLLHKFQEEACFICLRLCKDKTDLQQHTTSVHRFKCLMDECNSMFPSKALRDKHMLTKHGVHACTREDCQAIFSSIEEKLRHSTIPHPVDSADSDSGLSVAHARDLRLNYRPNVDVAFFSEPPRTASYQPTENHPYSADELSFIPRQSDTSQNAAHRLFRNHLKHLQTALKDLKEPLKKPVNPLCVDETISLCDDLISELTIIRDRYRRSYHFAEHFDIDLLRK